MSKLKKLIDIQNWIIYILTFVFASIILIIYFHVFTYVNNVLGVFKISITYLDIGVVVTLFVGLSAYVIFLKQNSDKKRDAAKVIFLEIQQAIDAINIIKTIQSTYGIQILPYEIRTLSTESWSKSKYLFINDFTTEQLTDINKFYELSKLYDEAVNFNNSYSEKNYDQFRIHIINFENDLINKEFKKIPKPIPMNTDDIKNMKEVGDINEKINEYTRLYLATAIGYYPQDPILRTNKYLSAINTNILTSSTGTTLRKLARI